MGNYNNNNNNYNGNQNNRNNNNQNNNNRNSSGSGKKHSGAEVVRSTKKGYEGVEFVRAWNYRKRRGLLTIFISEYKKTKTVRSEKSGIEYRNLLAKVHYEDSGVEKLMGALLSLKTNKITIPELGMVVNTHAANGGYCGTFKKK